MKISKFRSQIFLPPINGGLNVINGFSTIPDVEGDVTIPSHLYYNYPLYWMLPESFLGDKVIPNVRKEIRLSNRILRRTEFFILKIYALLWIKNF